MKAGGATIHGVETDKMPAAEKIAITLTPKQLEKYIGKYELAPGAILEVTTNESQIFAQLTGQPQFEIFPKREDVFFLKVVVAELVFDKDSDGNITGLILYQGGREMPGKRID